MGKIDKVTDETINKMVHLIADEISPEYIYLFGSHVTGNVTPDSYIDLLVIEKDKFGQDKSRWGELQRIRKVLSAFRYAKDILLYSHEEFERYSKSPNHIISNCIHEGRLLYERHGAG